MRVNEQQFLDLYNKADGPIYEAIEYSQRASPVVKNPVTVNGQIIGYNPQNTGGGTIYLTRSPQIHDEFDAAGCLEWDSGQPVVQFTYAFKLGRDLIYYRFKAFGEPIIDIDFDGDPLSGDRHLYNISEYRMPNLEDLRLPIGNVIQVTKIDGLVSTKHKRKHKRRGS